MVAAILSSLLLATSAAAIMGCGGHEMNTQCMHSKRQDLYNSDEACKWYVDTVRDPLITELPGIWNTSTDIVAGDTVALALFNEIETELNATFPDIKPHGTRTGDFSNVTYDVHADPDCWWTKSRCHSPGAGGLEDDVTTLPEPETWGLGIDDGPNCTNSLFYDFLKENNQKASLYYIGSNVYNWPQQARRGIEDGHQVCVHTWSHPAMTSRTNSQAFAELYYTRLVIQKILGRTPLCWRPPYGDVDNRIRFIASKLNLTLHLWSDDTFDWQVGQNNVTVQDVTANYEKVYAKAQNGTYTTHGPMVLNHEVNNYTMTEIIAQYPAMKQNFKHIVPIATGLNVTQPYAEPEIIYPTFEEYIGGEIQEAVVSNGVTVTQTSPSTSKTSGKSSTGSSGASNSNAAASVLVSSSTVLAGVFAALLL